MLIKGLFNENDIFYDNFIHWNDWNDISIKEFTHLINPTHQLYNKLIHRCWNENLKMLLLFRPRLPRPWHDVRPQRLQSLPILSCQMPQTLQSQTQPQKTRLDQSLQKNPWQITHQWFHIRILKETQLTPSVQSRHVCQDHPGHEKNCRYQRQKRRKVLAEQNETC